MFYKTTFLPASLAANGAFKLGLLSMEIFMFRKACFAFKTFAALFTFEWTFVSVYPLVMDNVQFLEVTFVAKSTSIGTTPGSVIFLVCNEILQLLESLITDAAGKRALIFVYVFMFFKLFSVNKPFFAKPTFEWTTASVLPFAVFGNTCGKKSPFTILLTFVIQGDICNSAYVQVVCSKDTLTNRHTSLFCLPEH